MQHCTFGAIECKMICILPKLNSLLRIFFFARIQRLRQNFVLSLTDDSLPNNSIWKTVSKKFSGDKNRFKKFMALKKQAAEKFRFLRKAREAIVKSIKRQVVN